MEDIMITGKAILDFLRLNASCCMPILVEPEPTENKKMLFEIVAKSPNKIFNLSELMEKLPIRNKSFFEQDVESITKSKGYARSINSLNRCDILKFFAQDHIKFMIKEAEKSSIKLGSRYITEHTLCACRLTEIKQNIANGQFINADGSDFARKVTGFVNFTGKILKQDEIVLVHFSAIIASISVCSELSDLQKLVRIQNELSSGKIGKALNNDIPIDYRNFANQNLTKITQERAKQITGNPFFITPS